LELLTLILVVAIVIVLAKLVNPFVDRFLAGLLTLVE